MKKVILIMAMFLLLFSKNIFSQDQNSYDQTSDSVQQQTTYQTREINPMIPIIGALSSGQLLYSDNNLIKIDKDKFYFLDTDGFREVQCYNGKPVYKVSKKEKAPKEKKAKGSESEVKTSEPSSTVSSKTETKDYVFGKGFYSYESCFPLVVGNDGHVSDTQTTLSVDDINVALVALNKKNIRYLDKDGYGNVTKVYFANGICIFNH